MNEFEFAFVVSGVDAHDEGFADRFHEAGCDDATLMLVNGLVAVCFTRSAESFGDAVISAYGDIQKTGAVVERFEPDFLVSKAEIAKRSSLSRAAITQYVNGERGRDFPPPCARITSASPLWDWVEVAGWLHQNNLAPAEEVVRARISRDVNHAVQHGEHGRGETGRSLAKIIEAAEREASAA